MISWDEALQLITALPRNSYESEKDDEDAMRKPLLEVTLEGSVG